MSMTCALCSTEIYEKNCRISYYLLSVNTSSAQDTDDNKRNLNCWMLNISINIHIIVFDRRD